MANVTPIENTSAVVPESASLADIVRLLNGGIRLDGRQTPAGIVDGGRPGHLSAVVRKVPFGTADTEVEVLHSIGRDAYGYLVIGQDRAGSIYVSRRASWDRQRILLKCDTADVVAYVVVF